MFSKLVKKKQEGFTIIEVMIVLAIAGLIMVVVLVAVPQLQRSQRDSARQAILGRVNTELNNFAANNDGRYPFTDATTVTDFVNRYIGTTVDRRNPSTGADYSITLSADATTNPSNTQILVYPGMRCNGEGLAGTYGAGFQVRTYALRIQLERADIYYCVDNNQ